LGKEITPHDVLTLLLDGRIMNKEAAFCIAIFQEASIEKEKS